MNDQDIIILGLVLLNMVLLIARQWKARPRPEPKSQLIHIDWIPESEFVEFYAQPTQLTLEL